MNDQKIEDIKNALRNIMQIIAARKEPLSSKMKLQLAKVIEFAANRIKELREEKTGTPPVAPNIPPSEYESSNVEGFKYDPETQELMVQFHGPYPQAKGSIYSYKDVPDFLVDIFSRGAVGPKTSGKNKYHEWIKGVTPSLGGSLNALVKSGGFEYEKVA